jgi:rhamnulose-1-phosphate aldolase
MSTNILKANFFNKMCEIINYMWEKGWDERNGGNVSYRLTEEEVEKYINIEKIKATYELEEAIPELAGEFFLVTGSGKYFMNVGKEPANNLGIIQIDQEGNGYSLHWGYENGGKPTSELPAHLLSHQARMQVTDNKNRVVIHTHATNLIALTYVLELDSKTFTRKLWEMSTECLVVFPEGVGILPWLVPGTEKIGEETSKLMRKHPIVIWPFHGVFGTGKSLDEAFGLIDTAEKAADILVKVNSMGGAKKGITDQEFKELAVRFGVEPMTGVLE